LLLLAGLGIFLGCLLFGSSVLSVLVGDKLLNGAVYNKKRIFILFILAVLAILFQPLLLVISFSLVGIGLALSIACLPCLIVNLARLRR